MPELVRLKLRSDLKITPQERRLETVWIIKDPVSFAHFLFSEQETFIVRLLDGNNTLEEIREAWMNRFKSTAISLHQLELFCQRLARDGLMMNQRIGDGSGLAAKSKKRFRRSLSAVIRNPLAIRLPGVNPGWILDLLAPVSFILFHPLVIALNLIGALAVLLLILGNAEDLSAKLPTITSLISSTGIVWLMFTLSFVKILHELGHAMACRKFGGDCTEIGILLLAFTPCLYCNVSDAWLFQEKRKRVLVSAAGIYVEIILSGIFAIVWFWTEPGWLNAMAFNIVLICSINTVLLNGNPLLRYDGYFILSDLVDIPNLGQRGGEAFRSAVMSLFDRGSGGIGSRSLAYYGGASLIYRCFVIFSILSGLYFLLKSYDMQVLAWFIAGLTLFGIINGSVQQFRNTLKMKTTKFRLNIPGAILGVGCAVGLLLLIFRLPLPSHVFSPAVVELRKPVYVYAPRDGEIVSAALIDTEIKAHSTIATMKDPVLEMDIELTRGLLDDRVELLQQLSLRQNSEPELVGQIRMMKSEVMELRTQLQLLETDMQQLTVKAPENGHLFPAPVRHVPANAGPDALQWSGTPLDPSNEGCYVARGDLLAILGDPGDRMVVAYVSESQIREVVDDAKVQLSFSQVPGRTFFGVVTAIVKEDVTVTPQQFLQDNLVDSVRDASGIVRPIETPYRVIVSVDDMLRRL